MLPQRCKYHLIDGPPANKTAARDNQAAVRDHVQRCEAFKKWKRNLGPQPLCPTTDEPLTQMPPNPKPIKRYLRCHCRQNFADPRTGSRCRLGNVYRGVPFPIGKCSICLCVCNAFVQLKDYKTIVTVSTLPTVPKYGTNSQHAARAWLESGTNINMVQQQKSTEVYRNMMTSGKMSRDGDITRNVSNEGALAQSLHMVANRPRDVATIEALCSKVDQVEHPLGPSHTSVGDMNKHGRATAADMRISNNSLISGFNTAAGSFNPSGITEG